MKKTGIVLVLIMILFMAGGLLFAGGEKETIPNVPANVIRFGTHYRPERDHTWRDPRTGKQEMTERMNVIYENAYNAVLKELGVKIEWVQYPGDTIEVITTSVLAGSPVCDVGIIYTGGEYSIMASGAIQELSPYADLFKDPEDAWMLESPLLGKQYLINMDRYYNYGWWPLVFNINYIERVPALKENGKTIYPTDLYKQGKWTWSTFRDYLEKIDAYYRNISSPSDPAIKIKAYESDYRYAIGNVLNSAGKAIVGANGIDINSPQSIKALEFLEDLIARKLFFSTVPGVDQMKMDDDFGRGNSVFHDTIWWYPRSVSAKLAERGETMGIVPWPRPDNMSFNDSRNNFTRAYPSSVAVLKGISPERTRLAIEAFKIWSKVSCAGWQNMDNFSDIAEKTKVKGFSIVEWNIDHPVIGNDIFAIDLDYRQNRPSNEFSLALGLFFEITMDIIGPSLFRLDDTPRISVQIPRSMPAIQARYNEVKNALVK